MKTQRLVLYMSLERSDLDQRGDLRAFQSQQLNCVNLSCLGFTSLSFKVILDLEQ
jgi:hypothetical protein